MTNKTTLIKSLSFFLMLFCVVNFGYGQTTLVKEDIAIIGVNTDNEDFTFVLRTDITAGTTIYFSDNEVNAAGTGLNNIGEGVILFTAVAAYSCGTVISFISNSTEFTSVNGSFALNNDGDEVLAFQGYNNVTRTWTTFLHANVETTIVYPVGFAAADIVDGTQDNRRYIGTTSSPSWADLNNITNYNQGNNFSTVTLSTTGFSCSPCPTTTTWNGINWSSGLPNNSKNVFINGNYTTSPTSLSFSACSLTVNGTLNITDGYYVEVENDVIVDGGEISVSTSGNFVQRGLGAFNLINSGNAILNKQTRSYNDTELHYVYWSSPVESADVVGVFPDPYLNRRFYFDASLFLDTDLDDIDDDANDWQVASGLMEVGRGYVISTVFPFLGTPYSDNASFSGIFNTGDIDVPIYRNSFSGDTNWNLIGNPYPSAIDAEAFLLKNYYDATLNPTGTLDGSIYLWTHNSPANTGNPGNEVYNFSQDDYVTMNLTGVVFGTTPAPSDPAAIIEGFIPSGQGFFASYANDGAVTSISGDIFQGAVNFNNSMRMADGTSNSQFFKNSNIKSKTSSSTNKLWVNLTSDNGVFNQILIGYLNVATNNYDGDAFDAPKNLSSDAAAILYSTINDSNKKFAIQAKAENSLTENEVIHLGFDTRIIVPTTYTLSVAQLQGDFLSNNKVYLKDDLFNTLHDLSASDYHFTSEAGEFKDRFEIVFNAQALSADTFNLDENTVQIIQVDDSHVTFKASGNLNIKSVAIYDLLGRQLYQLEGSHNEETYNLSNLNHSVFIAKIALSNGALITKKAIKK